MSYQKLQSYLYILERKDLKTITYLETDEIR